MAMNPIETQTNEAATMGATSHLPQLSDEERKQLLEKARVARAANAAARKASTLRKDFLDADLWLELANERGLRLPPWGLAATVSNLRAWCRKTGWTQGQFEDWAGCSLVHFVALNWEFPLRALAGIVLEEQRIAKPAE